MLLKFSRSFLLVILGGIIIVLLIRFDLVRMNFFSCKVTFQYINKKLACADPYVIKKHAYVALKIKLEDFIDSKVKEDDVIETSIYFRDLENGPTLGINEHTNFTPASLLKMPVMMAYLVLAQERDGLLDKKLKFHVLKDASYKPSILPLKSLQENTSYSIREMIEHMIKYSDNNAYYALTLYLNQLSPGMDYIKSTMSDLGILGLDSDDETITVKAYASLFVQLYHSSFLNHEEDSEWALKLLGESSFDKGIRAGVPRGIVVANKFGERISADGEIKQLHDCGIVYYPENPYLLCVMTRGYDLDKLASVISQISQMFYEEFKSRRI